MKKIVLLTVLLALSFAVQAQLPTELSAKLQDTLTYFKNQYRVKGISAAVSYKEFDTWTSALGESVPGQALSSDMLIGIGSNTKTFLSALMLKLYENGLINLNDTIGNWITGYPNINGAVTIRQLLTHTSGIAEYIDDPVYDSLVMHPEKNWTRAQLFDMIEAPYFAPGSSIAYSNSNYIIAGEIIEAVTGRELQHLFRDSIFIPLGLEHTFYPPFEPVADTYAGFWTNWDGIGNLDLVANWNTTGSLLPVNINTIARDAGAIVATAADVVLFWKNLLKGNIISKQTLNSKMFEWSGFGNNNDEYGLGVFFERYRGRPMFHHGGTWIGQINSNLNDTLHDIYIAVLSNQDSLDNDFTEMVAKALYDVVLDYQHTSVATTQQHPGVRIFPNPATDHVRINVPPNLNISHCSVHAINGALLKTIPRISNEALIISIADLNAGIYLLNYTIKDKTYYQKIIKK
jgi:CubicO group peptidase (beta-lactamase class C family)